jgi:hypothetical protein
MIHLLAGATASSSSSSSDSGAIVAASIAAVVALLAAVLTFVGNHRQQTLDKGAASRQADLQRELAKKSDELQKLLLAQQQQSADLTSKRTRVLLQMNELYGPLFMLRSESRRLRSRVGPDSSEWRVVDNIVELKADPVKSSIVESIISINTTLAELLVGKAGLLEQFPPPESFQDFLAHAQLLQSAWVRGENETDERLPFPVQFDEDVEEALNRLRALLGEASAP